MRLYEALARQIWRATVLRCRYEYVDYTGNLVQHNPLACQAIDQSLERAIQAMGSGDITTIEQALEALKEFWE